jgi:nucleoside 2-deoxyribosyltransferase
MNIYLCARVGYDIRPTTSKVATSLRTVGFTVYNPAEEAPNNLSEDDIREGRYDVATIFKMDYAAMKQADICVVVGRIGRDCAAEVGMFAAWEVPIYFVPGEENDYRKSPMLIPWLEQNPPLTVENVGAVLLQKRLQESESK